MSHLDARQLVALLNGGEDDHLSGCPSCQARLGALARFRQASVQAPFLNEQKTDFCPDEEELAEFVDGLSSDEQRIRAHIYGCDHCFASASYYFKSATSMEGALLDPVPERFKEKASDVMKEKRIEKPTDNWFDRFVIAPLPAYATAAVFIIFALMMPAPYVAEVVNAKGFSLYRSGQAQLFRFGGQKADGSLPGGLTVAPGRKNTTIAWSQVKGAKEYQLILYNLAEDPPAEALQVTTADTKAIFPNKALVEGNRYRAVCGGWLDGGWFAAETEFIFRRR